MPDMETNKVERRRHPPVTKSFVGTVAVGVVTAVIVALVVASWQATRVWGQTESQVETNQERILRNRQTIDRLDEQDRDFERKVNEEVSGIKGVLMEQHGVLSGMAATLQAIQQQLEREARQRRDGL
jgi:heme exporter protein D